MPVPHIFGTQTSPVAASKLDEDFASVDAQLDALVLSQFARHVREWGALPTASAAANTTAIQAALDWARLTGGVLIFEPNATYLMASPTLDIRYTAAGQKEYFIYGNNATLDFSASGKTTGELFKYGATALAYVVELNKSFIDRLNLTGPESPDNIIPETAYRNTFLGGGNATAVTTVHGFLGEFALGISLRHTYVTRCWKGYQKYYSWDYHDVETWAHKCIIGHHWDTACTTGVIDRPKAEFCTYAYLLHPASAGGAVIAAQKIRSVHAENCTVGVHIDPTSVGSEIQNIRFEGEGYFENVYRDAYRIGIAFDFNPANASVVGADRAGKITALHVDGFRFAGAGVGGDSYGTNRKAFRFATVANVCSGFVRAPCELGDIANLPPHVALEGTIRQEDLATQNVHTVRPGEGSAHVGSSGTLLWNDGGLISASARVSAGLYDVTLKRALSSVDNAAMVVASRQVSLYAAVDDTNTTATNIRVQLRTDAAVLTDGTFTIIVKGELTPI